MPGWYIHMESAKRTVDRLRAGNVSADFPGGIANAQQLGEIAHKWRNYLADWSHRARYFLPIARFHGSCGKCDSHCCEMDSRCLGMV